MLFLQTFHCPFYNDATTGERTLQYLKETRHFATVNKGNLKFDPVILKICFKGYFNATFEQQI